MPDSFGHGLVLGKFYPPHLGHLHLISEAAAGCEAVTVLVMAARGETLPLADRVAWLRAACSALPGVAVSGVVCDAPVDYGDPVIWTAQLAVIRAALDRDGRPPVDAVFTGEGYGGELAGRLGAEHVPVDPGRRAVPVSASRLRGDLAGHWEYLTDPAQAALAARVVVAGAESTGTTTVAALLTSHEGVPWHDDGLREGDLAVRAAMTGWFMTALTAAGHSWVLLTGSLDERLALATRVTDYVLENRSRFGASITEGAEIR